MEVIGCAAAAMNPVGIEEVEIWQWLEVNS